MKDSCKDTGKSLHICDHCRDEKTEEYKNSPIRIICDLCDIEMPLSTKQNGIWVCPSCDKKYPDVE